MRRGLDLNITVAGLVQLRAANAALNETIGIVKATTTALLDFEKQTARVHRMLSDTSTMSAVRQGMTAEMARLGVTTKQTGEAFYQLGTFIKDVPTLMKATATALNLVVGTESDVRDTTRAMIQVYNQFGQQLDQTVGKAENMRRVGELLAVTFRQSNAEMNEITQTLKYLGPVAETTRVSVSSLFAVIGALEAGGQRGRMAGTATAQFLNTLTTKYDPSVGGIRFNMPSGEKMVAQFPRFSREGGGEDILKTLEGIVRIGNQMPIQQAEAFVSAIGGTQGARRFLGTLQETLPRMRTMLEENTKAMSGVTNEAERLANIMVDTLPGRAQQAWQGLLANMLTDFKRFSDNIHLTGFFRDRAEAFQQGLAIKAEEDERRSLFQTHTTDRQGLQYRVETLQGILGRTREMRGSTPEYNFEIHPTDLRNMGFQPWHLEWLNSLGPQTESQTHAGLYSAGKLRDLLNTLQGRLAVAQRQEEISAQGRMMREGDIESGIRLKYLPGGQRFSTVTGEHGFVDIYTKASTFGGKEDYAEYMRTKGRGGDRGITASGLDYRNVSTMSAEADWAALPPEMRQRYGLKWGDRFTVTNPATGKSAIATLRDSGPAASTGRGLDLSGNLMKQLGADTDDVLKISLTTQGGIKPFMDPEKAKQKHEEYLRNQIALENAWFGWADKQIESGKLTADELNKQSMQHGGRLTELSRQLAKSQDDPAGLWSIVHGVTPGGEAQDRLQKSLETKTKDAKQARIEAMEKAAEMLEVSAERSKKLFGLYSHEYQLDVRAVDEARHDISLAKGDFADVQRYELGQKGLVPKREEELADARSSIAKAMQTFFKEGHSAWLTRTQGEARERIGAISLTERPEAMYIDKYKEHRGILEQERDVISGMVDQLRPLGEVKNATTEHAAALRHWQSELVDVNKQLANLEDRHFADQMRKLYVGVEWAASNEEFRNRLSRHPSLPGRELRDQLSWFDQDIGVASRRYGRMSALQSLLPSTPEDRQRLLEASQKVEELRYQRQYAIDARATTIYAGVQGAIGQGAVGLFRGTESPTGLLRKLGDMIVDKAIEETAKKWFDPLTIAVTKELGALEGLTIAVNSNTKALTGNVTGTISGSATGALGSAAVGAGVVGAIGALASTLTGKGSTGHVGAADPFSGGLGKAGPYLGAGLAAYSIFSQGQKSGITGGGILGGAMAGASIGSAFGGPAGAAIGAIAGGALDIIGGLFGGHHHDEPKASNPAFYNAPSDFRYGAYSYRATGKLPDMGSLHLFQTNAPIVNVYIDGVKTAVRGELGNVTSLAQGALSNHHFDLHNPL